MNLEKYLTLILDTPALSSWGIAGGSAGPSAVELTLWGAATAFLGIVALYRKRRRPYAATFGFLALSSLSALPLVPELSGLGLWIHGWALGCALQVLAWYALFHFSCALAELRPSPGKRWLAGVASFASAAALAAAAFVDLPHLGSLSFLASCLVRLGLGAAAIAILGRRGTDMALARQAMPSLVIWMGATLALLVPLAFLRPYAYAAYAAGNAIAAAMALLTSLAELARPSSEDTALDEYAKRLATSIRRFIPDEFLAHLKKDNVADLALGDHVKQDMTIFFSDIRAFTELSEALTPEESFAFINSYLSRVVPVITAHRGFVDKYMGDGIMALFSQGGGSDDAVESAVDIQLKMQEYNGHRAKMGYRPLSMGIGIHTGPLMMGVVGVTDRMEGTVISDSVNLASRLQSIAKAFNIPLVISERTFMNLSDPGRYKYRFIGKVRVKGKDAPVSVFEIFDGLAEELFERKMRSNTFFEQGMMAYYQKDFNDGVFYFKKALELVHEDGASRFYLETCLRKTMSSRQG